MSKKSKKKFTKLDLDFSHKPTSESWADIEVEKEQSDQYDLCQIQQLRQSLPSAPRATRAQQDVERIPLQGPFKAYVGNIPFDATENDLTQFFRNLTVKSVKFVTFQNKMRGFGYVEFETRDDLISALKMSDLNFQNRKIKIDLAESHDKHGEDGGNKFGNDRLRQERGGYNNRQSSAAESDSNWRAGGGPQPRIDNDRFGDRQRHPDENDRFGRENRSGYDRRDDRRYENRGGDRGGYNNSRYSDRRDDYRGGSGNAYSRRNDDRSDNWRQAPPRRDDDDYRGRGNEDSWRKNNRRNVAGETNGDGANQRRTNDTQSDERDQPRERPRLQLAPRTKPLEEKPDNPTDSTGRQSNIFGDAKPVDTLTKELEIESKLAKEMEEIMQNKVEATNQPSNYTRGPNPPASNPPRQNSALSPTSGRVSRTHLDSQNSSSSSQGRQRLSSGGVVPSRDHRISDNSNSFTEDSHNNNQSNTASAGTNDVTKKEPSDDAEQVKLVPAPIPVVNVWSKRKELQTHGDNYKSSHPPGTTNNSNSASLQSRPYPEAQASVSAKPPPQKVATVSVAKAFQPQQANAWARGPPRGPTSSGDKGDHASNDHSQEPNPPPNAWTQGDSSRIK